ncbi:hypothetical protein KHQ82_07205 [Mycoplasmatota bacterium]|nr:hypothetical protein KHQ82_07205 [Mycoplasmatota bacterium]
MKFLRTITTLILIMIVSSCFFNRSASIISDKYRVPKKDLIYLGEVSNYEIWKRDTISSGACTEDIVMPVILNRELQISGQGGSNCYTGVFAFKDGNAYMLSGPDYKVNGRTNINVLGISIEELCSIEGACKIRDFSEYPIKIMVGGRPIEERDNKLLIPDKLSNYGHVWVEINDDTYLPGDFPKTERCRYYLEFVIIDLDKSSYPWKATAVRAYYPAWVGENYNIIGPIVEAGESHILVNTLYQPGLASVKIDSNTKYAPGVSSDFKVGNLVNISYDFILESYPNRTAKEVLVNEKHFVPEIINNYLHDNGVYIGMHQNFPIYYNVANNYDHDYEETLGGYTIIGGSFSDYVLLVNDEVITLTDAIENELLVHCEYLHSPNLIVISD